MSAFDRARRIRALQAQMDERIRSGRLTPSTEASKQSQRVQGPIEVLQCCERSDEPEKYGYAVCFACGRELCFHHLRNGKCRSSCDDEHWLKLLLRSQRVADASANRPTGDNAQGDGQNEHG